ncbi:UNVERIFIED_CONTAM: hypothetical protein Sangu_2905900 [Sesamum angustifolium]|uniref:Uncharacterized protein n=1 Tax=Sesamum angustifolium TaxID=2727405 RepID=A0AAW2IND7_9LAMI
MGIALQGIGAKDALVWPYEKHGGLSARSAYKVARMLNMETKGSGNPQSRRLISKSKA